MKFESLSEDELFKHLEQIGVLARFDPHRHREAAADGWLFLNCGDADFCGENIDYLRRVTGCSRAHFITINGGGLVLAKDSPVSKRRPNAISGIQLMEEIEEACRLKGIKHVLACAHSHCGARKAAGLSEVDAVRLIAQGKIEFRSFAASRGLDVTIGSAMNIRKTSGSIRTWQLKATKARELQIAA